MNSFKTIRYMGVKTKLLEYIVPAIDKVTPIGGTVCDLMAGSNVVAYSLKDKYNVISNDVQEYSYVIAKAVIENPSFTISSRSAKKDLLDNLEKNKKEKHYDYFEKNYSYTYFSENQCIDIDAIRYAIEFLENEYAKSLYLLALMVSMSKLQSTPGHFAQFMPKDHSRIKPLQQKNLLDEFLRTCDEYTDIFFSDFEHKSFNEDYNVLIDENYLNEVNTIYLDSPYNQEQYSRFYHVLETVVKYDYPSLKFKGLYRSNRFMSKFSYKKYVSKEFEKIMKYCSSNSINLVISYSNKGLISIDQIESLANKHFKDVSVEYIDYKHSTQGKGMRSLKEVIISCTHN